MSTPPPFSSPSAEPSTPMRAPGGDDEGRRRVSELLAALQNPTPTKRPPTSTSISVSPRDEASDHALDQRLDKELQDFDADAVTSPDSPATESEESGNDSRVDFEDPMEPPPMADPPSLADPERSDVPDRAVASPTPSVDATDRHENDLAVVRLGMATSLFYALRTKHRPTAAHSLRVAFYCSTWSERLGLTEDIRDRIEVAALLHDLGKIGIPDRILRKSSKLTTEEQLTMDVTPELGCEILRGCTSDIELLDIVRYGSSWFQSRRDDEGPRGDALPIGSRMLAIADAFDAMTTDSVYRRAISREMALAELIAGGGTQFDPELVGEFCRMLEQRPEMLHGVVIDRWLGGLHGHDPSQQADFRWTGEAPTTATHDAELRSDRYRERAETVFFNRMIADVRDGIVFTDAEGTITHWNAAMHMLTDLSAEAMVGKSWNQTAIGLQTEDDDDGDLVSQCLTTQSVRSGRFQLESDSGESIPIKLQVSPVTGSTPGLLGCVLTIRDYSDHQQLQRQVETLHKRTTSDSLTGVANRPHFDETLDQFTEQAADGGDRFSLIICDIDHFKRVNDVFGHPAGDEALIRFADVLRSHSREGDLVARYGGEEFLLLAPKCDNPTAARRAEAIRMALEKTPLPSLNHEAITASFGVTEFQPGDTAETILARADRALLKAKDNGRNRVIQLGVGGQAKTYEATQPTGWLNWWTSRNSLPDGVYDIVTPVPVDLAIEKLRGFIADHHATIAQVRADQVILKLNVRVGSVGRRRVDQHFTINAALTLSEIRNVDDEHRRSNVNQTNVHVELTPVRNRDRRSDRLSLCYDKAISSIRSYLMGDYREG